MISTILNVVIALFVVGMVLIMVKGLFDQKKDNEKKTSRYESMITEGGKTALTKDILEEDHDQYVKDANEAERTFLILAIGFLGVMVLVVIRLIFGLIIKHKTEGPSLSFTLTMVSFIGVVFIFTFFVVICFKFIAPKLASHDYANEKYYFEEIKLADSKKKEEYVETNNGDTRTTEKRVYYYLVEENGTEHEVTKLLYDRFVGAGVYYAGRTARGIIFSVYPDEYFEPAW